MIASVKGSRAKRSRAKPFNDWAVPVYITVITAEVPTRFFSKIASIFKKVLHLKDLNRRLECILM